MIISQFKSVSHIRSWQANFRVILLLSSYVYAFQPHSGTLSQSLFDDDDLGA